MHPQQKTTSQPQLHNLNFATHTHLMEAKIIKAEVKVHRVILQYIDRDGNEHAAHFHLTAVHSPYNL